MIYIAGGTLAMQALVGRSLDFMCTGGTPFIYAYLKGVQGKIIDARARTIAWTCQRETAGRSGCRRRMTLPI